MSVAHYENFPVASLLVPRRLRRAVIAIYAFARTADDIADEGNFAPAARLAGLARLEQGLVDLGAGRTPPEPPFPELAAAIARHGLPLAPLHDLLDAFGQDVTVGRYATFDDVLDYCRRSANPIGRLLLALYDAASAENVASSDAICTALQLVNFWQDVASDWERGRVYLPQEDLARFAVTEAAIAAGRAEGPFAALMRFETGRTRAMLESGRRLTRALPWRLGLELGGVLAGGHAILDAIDRVEGDVFRSRPVLRRRDWLRVAVQAVVPARRHRGLLAEATRA